MMNYTSSNTPSWYQNDAAPQSFDVSAVVVLIVVISISCAIALLKRYIEYRARNANAAAGVPIDNNAEDEKEDEEKRMAQILFHLKRSSMILDSSHFQNSCAGDVEEGASHIVIEEATSSLSNCAICIQSYVEGETIVWTPQCRHVFHESCIKPWLLKKTSDMCCPCCRQKFVIQISEDSAKGENGNESTP